VPNTARARFFIYERAVECRLNVDRAAECLRHCKDGSRAHARLPCPAALSSRSQTRLWRVAASSCYSAAAATDRAWEKTMSETWETPSFDEIRMDAEIGSYADEFADDRD
jgi:hypothetical protein